MENKTTTAQKKNNLRNVDEFETFNLIQVPLMDGIVSKLNTHTEIYFCQVYGNSAIGEVHIRMAYCYMATVNL